MSKLEELINQLCPDGVEYVKINEIADTFIGLATSVTKYKTTNGVQLLHNSDIADGQIVIKNLEYLDESFVKKNEKKLLKENDVITVHTGDVGTSAVITKQYDGCIGFTTISSRIKNTTEITPEFLCRFLNSNLCKSQIVSKTISDRSNLNLSSFDEIVVPIPPLPIQKEIVRILDNMTSLTAELTAELKARQKQYVYYRDSLLSFDEGNAHDGVRWMKLGDVLSISRGVRVVRAQLNDVGQYPVYQNALAPLGYFDSYNCEANKTFVISAGAAGEIGYCYSNFWAADDCYYFNCNEKGMIERYLYYVLLSQQHKLLKMVRKASIPRLGRSALENLLIPVPSFEEQQRIVSILDRFDKLCNDISEGLPAEIEARKKQYEYYRDKLLTFKEKEA